MKKTNFFIFLSLLFSTVGAQEVTLKTKADSVSYGVGANFGTSIKAQFPEANVNTLIQAIKDAIKPDASTNVDMNKINTMMNQYFQQKQAAAAQAQKPKKGPADPEPDLENMKEDWKNFMAENAKKKGVKVTPSGLQYLVLKEGEGDSPVETSKVTVHYLGTTPEGVEFDSSFKRNQPATFPLNGVIKGWTEGVQLMKVGAKYKFFIPQELAYGANAPGQIIKPFMPLVFEVELLEIVK